jgi:molecular chaperone GrpE
MKSLLTVLDEFEISILAIKDEKMKESFVLMQKNLLKILQSRGLEKIDALDKKFDPYFHEVVMMQPSDKLEGTVLFEVQKGYKLNGKVLRYSKVVVSAGTPKTA